MVCYVPDLSLLGARFLAVSDFSMHNQNAKLG